MLSNMPKAHTSNMVAPVIPVMAIMALPLFLAISLRFHLVLIDVFRNNFLVVNVKFLFLIFGVWFLKALLAGSFNIFLHDRYVISVTSPIMIVAKIKFGKLTYIFTSGIS